MTMTEIEDATPPGSTADLMTSTASNANTTTNREKSSQAQIPKTDSDCTY